MKKLIIFAELLLLLFYFIGMIIIMVVFQPSGILEILLPVGFGLLGLLLLISLTACLIIHILSNTKQADPVFTELGFKASSHLFTGRSYKGVYVGRHVTVTYMPQQRAMAAAPLNISVATRSNTHMAIATKRPMLGCSGGARVSLPESHSAHKLYIMASDQARALSLLTNTSDAVIRLTTSLSPPGYPELYIKPDIIELRLHTKNIVPEIIRSYLQDLALVAKQVEENPA